MNTKVTRTKINNKKHHKRWLLTPMLLLLVTLSARVITTQGGDASMAGFKDAVNTTIGDIGGALNRTGQKNFSRWDVRYIIPTFAKEYNDFTHNILLWLVGLTPESKDRTPLTFMFYLLVGVAITYLIASVVYLLVTVLVNANKSFSCVFKTIGKVFFCCSNKSKQEKLERLRKLVGRQSVTKEQSTADRYRAQNLILIIVILIGAAFFHGQGVDVGISKASGTLRYFKEDVINGFRSSEKTYMGLKQIGLLISSLSNEVLKITPSMAYDYLVPQKLVLKGEQDRLRDIYKKYKNATVSGCGTGKPFQPDFIKNLTENNLYGNFGQKVTDLVASQNDVVQQLKDLKTSIFLPLSELAKSGKTEIKAISDDLVALNTTIQENIALINETGSPYDKVTSRFFSVKSDTFFLLFKICSVLLVATLVLAYITTCLNLSNPKSSFMKSCFVSFTKNSLTILLLICCVGIAYSTITYLALAKQSVALCGEAQQSLQTNSSVATIFNDPKLAKLVNKCGANNDLVGLMDNQESQRRLNNLFTLFDKYKSPETREKRYTPIDRNYFHKDFEFLYSYNLLKNKIFSNNPEEEPQAVVDEVNNSGDLECVSDQWTINGTCPNYKNQWYPRYYYWLGKHYLNKGQKSCLSLRWGNDNLVKYDRWFKRYEGTCAKKVLPKWQNLNKCVRDIQNLSRDLLNAVWSSTNHLKNSHTHNGHGYYYHYYYYYYWRWYRWSWYSNRGFNIYRNAKSRLQNDQTFYGSIQFAEGPSKEAQVEQGLKKENYKPVERSLDCDLVRNRLVTYAGNSCFSAAKPLAYQALIVSLIVALTMILTCYLASFLKQAAIDLKVEEKKENLGAGTVHLATEGVALESNRCSVRGNNFQTLQSAPQTPHHPQRVDQIEIVVGGKKACAC